MGPSKSDESVTLMPLQVDVLKENQSYICEGNKLTNRDPYTLIPLIKYSTGIDRSDVESDISKENQDEDGVFQKSETRDKIDDKSEVESISKN